MRQRFFLAATAFFGFGVATTPPIIAQNAPLSQRDWTQSVVQTLEGGFMMGNPAAIVKVVEFGSLGCPACAGFAEDGAQPLREHVRSGRVSFEFRNHVLSPPDLAASLLSRCGGPATYFRLNEAFLSAQPQWFARLEAAPDARLEAIAKLPLAQQMAPLAAIAGFDAIAAKAGIGPAQAKKCLTDAKAVDRLIEMRQAAETRFMVTGTPTFFINGRRANHVHAWSELAPLIKASGG